MPSRLPVLRAPGPSPPPSLCAPSAWPPPPAATPPGQLFLGPSPLPQAQRLVNLFLPMETQSTCQGLGQLLIYRWRAESKDLHCCVFAHSVRHGRSPPAKPPPPLSSLALTSPHSCRLLSPERLCSSPPFALDTLGYSPVEELNHRASISETQQWLYQHRFSSYCQMLANFTGPSITN
ncbi:uncharacterized protein LOC116552523 isoform X2 [Sapajus apella]|uniref:Uncharacterized protein LOC116552523 isoform X2 n=1 Tax=Sapajus apella TaxID=9515 RepID=A0A6J3HYK6_SAPAP|nr:uncharacterized protein LOC116552523 isoform X2 [Sapajus apella]